MIIVDVETTGDFGNRHGLHEIGAVDFSNPGNRFYTLVQVRPEAEVDTRRMEFHGFDVKSFYDLARPPECHAIRLFDAWARLTDDKTLGGMNVSFDEEHLEESYRRYGLRWPFSYRTVDQHALAYASMLRNGFEIPMKRGGSYLHGDAIMSYVGLPPEPRPHKGINGAVWEGEALSRLIYGKSRMPEFAQYPVPAYLL